MIPIIIAGITGLGAFLSIDRFAKGKAPTAALQSSAEAFNANADAVAAANALSVKAGATPVGHGPRQVNPSEILQGPVGGNPPSQLVFSRHSPAAFFPTTPEDIGVVAQCQPGFILTVDVKTAGIARNEIPEGNMLMVVTAPSTDGRTLGASSIDPRAPGGASLAIPLTSVTDAWGNTTDLKGHIIGMGQ